MNFRELKQVHFVGIGGIGMSGLAEVVAARGPAVSGCDLRPSSVTRRLVSRGIPVSEGHDPAHIGDADLVIASSAVRANHPELESARERGVRVMRRAEALGLLTREHPTIAVAGTHGKTTTTAMVSTILELSGADPTLVVGGMMRNLGSNARVGSGELLVIEADEFDRSFLQFDPRIAVVTNLETDHLDCYRDLDDLVATFGQFVARIPAEGTLLLCADDAHAPSLASAAACRVISYGTAADAELRISEVSFEEGGSRFLLSDGEISTEVKLLVPGLHNIRNAVAAIGAARAAGVDLETAVRLMGEFSGVERRFQRLGTFRGAELVDDYAHHPTEIRSTIDAARTAWPLRRICAVFQPHLYSRTRDFHREFGEALSQADLAWVLPIYPAREEPIEGVDASLIVAAGAGEGRVTMLDASLEEATEQLRDRLDGNDVLITMGAGDVHQITETLAEEGR